MPKAQQEMLSMGLKALGSLDMQTLKGNVAEEQQRLCHCSRCCKLVHISLAAVAVVVVGVVALLRIYAHSFLVINIDPDPCRVSFRGLRLCELLCKALIGIGKCPDGNVDNGLEAGSCGLSERMKKANA